MKTRNLKNYAVPAVFLAFGVATAFATACGDSGGAGGATTTSGTTVSVTATTGTMTTVTSTTGTMTGTSTTTTGSSTSTGMMFPTAPTLGAEIDRMGRPGINTALNHAFDPTAATKTMAKDAYNQDKDPSNWATMFVPEIASNLGILDAVDANCGNQLAAGANPVAGRYNTLAGVLADDRLYLDTSTATCTNYLGAEAHALLNAAADCGGRKLDYRVMDETYSVLATGMFPFTAGVTNGIMMNDSPFTTTFPYEAAPH